jgi:hypothetical protein
MFVFWIDEFFVVSEEHTASVFGVSDSGSLGCWSRLGRKDCVSYVGKLEEIWPIRTFHVLLCLPQPWLFRLPQTFPYNWHIPFFPTYFSIHVNQNQWPWRQKQYIPPKYWKTHLLHGAETQTTTKNWSTVALLECLFLYASLYIVLYCRCISS